MAISMTKQLKMLNKNKRKLNKLMVGVSNIFEEDKLYFLGGSV